MAKPAVLIVPGSFSEARHYKMLVEPLTAAGYETKAIHNLSSGLGPKQGRPGPLPSMADDAAQIAREIAKLADQGRDVVVFAHSYGGVPATESTKGLEKSVRGKEGKKGGVVRLAYISSLVPQVGKTAADVLEAVPESQRFLASPDENGWLEADDLEQLRQGCYNDLSVELGTIWVEKFTKHSSLAFDGPLTHAGYKNVPVSYLLCEDDLIIPNFVQRSEIELIERESGNKVDVTTLNSGHCPMVSQVDNTVNWMLKVLEKAQLVL